MKIKKNTCRLCGDTYYHGATVRIKGMYGFVWVCQQCLDKIDAMDKAEAKAVDK